MGNPPLDQGYGYGIVIGFGAFFSLFITALYMVEKRYSNVSHTSEEFSTAGRSIKIGLLASSVVSAWTWAATLLQSSSVAYDYGVSGPYWYAAGATIQVLLFAILAIEIKRKAPMCHTFPEVIKARYGTTAHIVFIYFGLATNMIVTAMLLLGGAAVATNLTGMNIYAACFLIPVGTILYVVFGGLRATFLTDYMHTVALFIIILVFGFTVYATSPLIGSPKEMYNLLSEAVNRQGGVKNNRDHSYLTMASKDGLIFGVINIVGNFGTVFCDQAYWQRAIAARPSSTVKGYLIGGLCWFSIPFFLATTLGLAGVALENNPKFPTFPARMPAADVGAGLVAPNAAVALLGSSGAVAILILVFLAVTSASSAELIAVSSILTYDIYRSYINPAATGDDIIRVSHYTTLGFGVFMGALAAILNNFGITLGYLYLLMGIIVAPAVIPIAFTLTWSKQSANGAIFGSLGAFAAGLITWLVTAKGLYGAVNLESTGDNISMLSGNLVSLLFSFFITVPVSLMNPQNFDFEATKNIGALEDEKDAAVPQYDVTKEEDPEALNKALKFSYTSAWTLTAVLIFLFPLPLMGEDYVFSVSFFEFWVVIGFIWSIIASLTVIVFPIFESMDAIIMVCKGMAADMCGGGFVKENVNVTKDIDLETTQHHGSSSDMSTSEAVKY